MVASALLFALMSVAREDRLRHPAQRGRRVLPQRASGCSPCCPSSSGWTCAPPRCASTSSAAWPASRRCTASSTRSRTCAWPTPCSSTTRCPSSCRSWRAPGSGEEFPRGCGSRWRVGFLGVLVILRPGSGLMEPVALLGVASALFAAVAQVGVRRLTRTEPVARIVFYFAITATFLSALPAAAVLADAARPGVGGRARPWASPPPRASWP